MRNILFITGTRADYGKIKSIIKAVESHKDFNSYIFVCGMHLLGKYGGTYREIIKDKFKNIYLADKKIVSSNMTDNIGNLILSLNQWIKYKNIDLIFVLGDRTEALGGAIVGALNNIKVAHIEGGELSGTIDESLRHSISKLANFHFVSNLESKKRLIQMGENKKNIYVIGSPDIDVMIHSKLPSLVDALKHYNIKFKNFSIVMFHPVTTENNHLAKYTNNLVRALIDSKKQYVVIYPNNDTGSEIIIENYKKLQNNPNFVIFPSIRFEYFLTLLKNCDFIIGNSSCGIRETCVFGVKSIDIGTRQQGRYNNKKIIHTSYNYLEILNAIKNIKKEKYKSKYSYGKGGSSKKFIDTISKKEFWQTEIQKKFFDIDF